MGEKAIIRLGDPTSHGGKVLEGFMDNICMGKPIAGVGHKVLCPKCKGTFPIVEGAQISLMMGKNVAVEGMKTACGATLIATQQTDTILVGAASGGGGGGGDAKPAAAAAVVATAASAVAAEAVALAKKEDPAFDEKFILVDEDSGKPLANTEYAVRRASGKIEHGTTDDEGRTHLLSSTAKAESIDIYV